MVGLRQRGNDVTNAGIRPVRTIPYRVAVKFADRAPACRPGAGERMFHSKVGAPVQVGAR